MYCAFILSSLLYACETWTVYSCHAKQLISFHMRCLRKLLYIKWQGRIPDIEVLWKVNKVSIHAMLKEILAEVSRACVSYVVMSACQRSCSMVSWNRENAPMGTKRNAIKTYWKSAWRAAASILTLGRKLQKLMPCGTAWSTLGWLPMKRVESVRPCRSTNSGRTEQATPLCPTHTRPYSVPNTIESLWHIMD